MSKYNSIADLKNKIILGDSLEILKLLPDKCIDLVLTDPPYGIGMDKNAGLSDKYTAKNWDSERPSKIFFDEIIRVSKNQIIFGGNYFVDLLPLGCWDLWDKRCNIVPRRTFADGELIYKSIKSPLRIYYFLWDGFLQQDMKNKEQRFHPTQKPVKLIETILRDYAPNLAGGGLLVADFFSGSGTTAVACYNLGLDFIAVEKDEDYFKMSVERLKNAQSQMKLFRL